MPNPEEQAPEENSYIETLDTPAKYKKAFYAKVGELAAQGEVTSEDVVRHIGLPPHHPSAVGSIMPHAARYHGLVKIGSRQALGRHQHYMTVWAKPQARAWTPKIVPHPNQPNE